MKLLNNQKGFTLIELSIVIAIIGLIVAGVTAGQSLVKQAQIRGILTQADQIRAVVNAFKLQYNALPGDISNASSYWANGCNAAGTGASVDSECNGDGNKEINIGTGTDADENYEAWLHLSLAKLYPGAFIPGTSNVGVINTNIPAGRFPGTGITLGFDSKPMTGINISKNIILFGAATGLDLASGAFLTPPQAYALDSKADDGNATSGSIYGGEAGGGGTNDCHNDAIYVLSSSAIACVVGFVL